MFTVLSGVTIVEGMVVKEEDRQLFIFITFSDALHNPISLTYLASCVRVCTYVTAILTAFEMWILTVVFRALKCSLFFLLEKLCSSLQLSSGLRKRWTCCCGNIRSLCTWSFVFFHAPASSSVPLFLSLSHHLFHLLSHVIISPLQTSYPCLQSVPSHPGNCPFLKMRLNLANSASIGWPVAQPPRRWGTLLCKSRSCPTATGKPTQLTSCITWPPGLLTGTRTHAHTHSCSGWYITLWICGTSYTDSLKCNILLFFITLFKPKTQKKKWFF